MTASLVSLLGVSLALLGGALSASAASLRWWRAAAALTVALTGAGIWWTSAPVGAFEAVQISAMTSTGPATTRVVVQNPGDRRSVFVVPITRTVEQAPLALGAMIALGLLGLLGAAWKPKLALPAQIVAGAAALGGVLVFSSAGGGGSGETAVRSFLQSVLPDTNLHSFTVPEAWTFTATGIMLAAVLALVAGAPALLRTWIPQISAARTLIGLGAALASVAVVLQILAVGGLPWRPIEGALWASALLSGGAFYVRTSPAHAATLLGTAMALATLGFTGLA